MNAPVSFYTSDAAAFSAAEAAFNSWRGCCIESFARAEALIVAALLRHSVKLPKLVGERSARLAEQFAGEGDDARLRAAALAQFQSHDRLRHFLCHGTTRIALRRGGKWIASMTMPGASQIVDGDYLVIGEVEAEALLVRLRNDLESLRRALALQNSPGTSR